MMTTTETETDVEANQELEDGELQESDVEEGTYIPLARPEAFNPPSLVHMQIQDDMSDEQSPAESSGSDESDDEPRHHAKRSKIRPKRPQPQTQPNKKEKYNVWCQALQEDLLTEDMVSCDVSKKSRYGVESYDYTIKYRLDNSYNPKKVFTNGEHKQQSHTNKRRHSDRVNVKLRLGKRVNSHQPLEERQDPRHLPDLVVTTEDTVNSISLDIAEKLNEEKADLIGRIVEVLGASKAIEIYKETQRVEAEGGMLIMNGARRRTPGGVYFFLLKRDDDVSQAMVNQIFNEDRKETTRKMKKARAKSRQKVMEQLKQSLTESELPALLSRGEATVQSEHGSNPPPSPATDAKDCSSDTDAPLSPPRPVRTNPSEQADRTDRTIHEYDDDDFLEVMCNDDMDMF